MTPRFKATILDTATYIFGCIGIICGTLGIIQYVAYHTNQTSLSTNGLMLAIIGVGLVEVSLLIHQTTHPTL